MPAPQIIHDLVDRFARNEEQYRSADYNEAQTRQEFIDPMFKALGWDMDNVQGWSELNKEVIHEDSLVVGEGKKAPDYGFRVGDRRYFFVEAKKPRVNIYDSSEAAFQLKRYARSAKLSLSVLTNFCEFAVYDCRYKESEKDKPGLNRIQYFTYDQYVEKWDEIAKVFSRDALWKGSFDKYVVETKGKRGTLPIDEEFLQEIETWREDLARNIYLRNPKVSMEDLNFAVGKIIDRMLFLRICEDRGIEEYQQIEKLRHETGTYEKMLSLFRKADDWYNAGLFHFNPKNKRMEAPDLLTASLRVDDKVLKGIIQTLYLPKSSYEFSVFPADILGQVYEQFLGKVIVKKGRSVDVEPKPEVKKAGGVYYTPTYIVDYIVKHTVGKLLENKTPDEVSKLKILDPACGSGSFLLGAYDELLKWHLTYYEDQIKKHGANPAKLPVNKTEKGGLKLTLTERKRILTNNIYGVDIDAQAVEVSKLSLLLKVLEGQSRSAVESEYKIAHHALPDLGNNIKCGNSLVGPDIAEMEFPSAVGTQHAVSAKKVGPTDEELHKINPFDWKKEFAPVFMQGGFDAVIGNPPYGALFSNRAIQYLQKQFRTFVWRGESYIAFVEQAITLLKDRGQFGYIIPDTYLNLEFTKSMRDFLLLSTTIQEIVVLPSRVFNAATVDTTLIFAERKLPQLPKHPINVSIKLFDKGRLITSITLADRSLVASTSDWIKQGIFSIQSDSRDNRLIARLKKSSAPISDIAEMFSGVKVYEVGKGIPPQTEKVRDEKPYTSRTKKSRSFEPFYDGKHIGRYKSLWNQNNWIKYGKWLAAPRDKKNFMGKKILIRKIVDDTLISTLDEGATYCNTLLFILKVRDEKRVGYLPLLGILNSRFIGWYFRKEFQVSNEDTFPQIMIKDILKIPFPKTDKSRHDKMVKLVEKMLELNKKLPDIKSPVEQEKVKRQIESTDKQIDDLVYELYGLTPEEIAIVEGK